MIVVVLEMLIVVVVRIVFLELVWLHGAEGVEGVADSNHEFVVTKLVHGLVVDDAIVPDLVQSVLLE